MEADKLASCQDFSLLLLFFYACFAKAPNNGNIILVLNEKVNTLEDSKLASYQACKLVSFQAVILPFIST